MPKYSPFSSGEKDPFGLAEQRRKEAERYQSAVEAAALRNPEDPRSRGFSEHEMETLIIDHGKQQGFLAGATTFTLAGAAMITANILNTTFRKRLGVSGKMALVVMPTIGLAALTSELSINAAKRDKQAFLDNLLGKDAIAKNREITDARLSVPKRIANTVYDSPYWTLGICGGTAVGTIFSLQPKALTLQQKILHSRVMGQFSVLAILCSLMGFMDYMRRRGGPFVE